jgi:hypothetical protein
MGIAAPSVAANPWFVCAILFTLRFAVLGCCWSWWVSGRPHATPDRALQIVRVGAASLLLGLLVNGLVALSMAEAGLYQPAVEVCILIAVGAAGLGMGLWRLRAAIRSHVMTCAPVVTLTLLAVFVIMVLPRRGEWIAGGWDPGTYVNQGVSVSREQTFHPAPEPHLASLSREELNLFTRTSHNFLEYMPVVPLDPDTRQIRHFFFRFMPATVAVLERCGGLRAATRINFFAGWITAWAFAALLTAWPRGRIFTAVAMAALLSHPVWWFLIHFPTSEMLQLALILGLLAGWPPGNGRWSHQLFVALLLFAATLNRFSFLPFGGLFLCALTWSELPQTARVRSWAARWLHAAAILAGLYVDARCCAVTIGRLDELVLPLLLSGLGLMLLSLMAETIALHERGRAFLLLAGRKTAVILLLLSGIVLLVLDIAIPEWTHIGLMRNLAGALPFLGIPLCVGAAAGAAWTFIQKEPLNRETDAQLLFLAAAVLMTVGVAAIAGLYPWAVRRHLVYTVPLLCLLFAVVADRSWNLSGGRAGFRAALLLACGLVLAPNLRSTVGAVRHTEFDGLSRILSQAADRVGAEDIVVADHFRWGTPLRFIYGCRVLNGEVLWQDGDAERMREALHALELLCSNGGRLHFLTSTEKGLAVYPFQPARTEETWSSGPIELAELDHHTTQRSFAPRTRTKHFRLYTIPAQPNTPN